MDVPRNRRDLVADLLASLWLMPTAFILAALVLGAALSSVEVTPGEGLGRLAFRGDVDQARQTLIVVTGTMITVTSLVFALTVVALQIASTQFSPRLLRTFLSDRGAQVVLSTFVATVAYAMAGLYTVGNERPDGEIFLPRLAVSGGLLLALASVGMLVYYIHHLTDSIRIDTVMRRIERQTLTFIAGRFPLLESERKRLAYGQGTDAPVEPADDLPVTPEHVAEIPAQTSGYVQRMHLRRLADQSQHLGVVIRLVPMVGFHVTAGRPLALAWAAEPGGDVDVDAVSQVLFDTIELAPERRTKHDLGFGLRQMVDVANRALAPSLNDSYTGVQAVHHLSVMLSSLAGRRLTNAVVRDGLGRVRVALANPTFGTYLHVVCGDVRRSARGRPRVYVEMIRMLENIGSACTLEDRIGAVEFELDLVVEAAEQTVEQTADLPEVHHAAEQARRTLAEVHERTRVS